MYKRAKKPVSMGAGGLARSIASEWAAFEQMGMRSAVMTEFARYEARALFYAGFKSCFRIMDDAIVNVADLNFADFARWSADIDEEIENFRQEMLTLAEKHGQ